MTVERHPITGRVEIKQRDGTTLLVLSEDEAVKLAETLRIIALSQARRALLKPETRTHAADTVFWP